MGIFNKLREPIFFKEDNTAKNQLAELEKMLESAKAEMKKPLLQEIRFLKAGIAGEEQILFELKNSHMPMYVLHGILLEHEELSAQIDFIIITPKMNFIVECKNLYGNIEITADGKFIRTLNFEGKYRQEGIYSPITQNERHMELLKKLIAKEKKPIYRYFYEKYFDNFNYPIIVLANPKTVLNDHMAPTSIKNCVIRADQLINYIKTANINSKETASSEKEMKVIADHILKLHQKTVKNYTGKYSQDTRESSIEASADEKCSQKTIMEFPNNLSPVLPRGHEPLNRRADSADKCPLCQGKLLQRNGKYGAFWGCSNFPICRYTKKIPQAQSS